MGKKAVPDDRKKNTRSTRTRSKRNLNQLKNDSPLKLSAQLISQRVEIHQPPGLKNETCSICLNPVKRMSFSSGCFHSFCFNCITKWASVSNNCPVCRKEYKTILHNLNTDVKVIKFSDVEPQKEQFDSFSEDSTEPNDLSVTDSSNTNEKARKSDSSFYVFEAGNQQMVGVPIKSQEQITNNIIQLNINNTNNSNNIPEIDIMNVTKNDKGGRIITRHNYQLASAEQQELINELITSAVNRSIEEHNETIEQISSLDDLSDTKQSNPIRSQRQDLTRLIDVYTFDRTRRIARRRRQNINFIPSGSARYNLRPIEGSRVNLQVNRTRISQWNP